MKKKRAVWGSPRWVEYRGARELSPAMFADQAVEIRARLSARSELDGGECRLWTGAVNADGYGRLVVRIDGVRVWVYVHRLACALAGVTVGVFDEVDHACERRRCFNVDHLRVVSDPENRARLDLDRRDALGRFAPNEPPI